MSILSDIPDPQKYGPTELSKYNKRKQAAEKRQLAAAKKKLDKVKQKHREQLNAANEDNLARAPVPYVKDGFGDIADIPEVVSQIMPMPNEELPPEPFYPHWTDSMDVAILGAAFDRLTKLGYRISLDYGEEPESVAPAEPVIGLPPGMRVTAVKQMDYGKVIEYEPIPLTDPHGATATGFVKHDAGKPRFDLIPPEVELELAKVYEYGARKYTENNFRKGTSFLRYLAAARRHMGAWHLGEDLDPESKINHLSHAIASLSMLLCIQLTGSGEDNRVTYA